MKIFYSFLITILVVCMLSPQITSAQKEHNVWNFGNHAGIDFNSGSAVALTNSALNQFECCESVCDPNTGALLFYTNGDSVWDATNHTMPNGYGITTADPSSAQGAIIVPLPGSTTKYYIFTSADYFTQGSQGYNYSIVDMTLNGGLGDLMTKDINIYSPACEKLFFTRNASSTGYWIATHEFSTNRFVLYEFTSSGLSAPVYSAVGIDYSTHQYTPIGCIKFSHDGKKIIASVEGLGEVEIFDFDNATGIVSNPVDIGPRIGNNTSDYSVEFSPGNRFIYVSEENTNKLFQLDVTSGNSTTIFASMMAVGSGSGAFQGIQLAPDGKIYVSHDGSQYVAAVSNPDSAGIKCNFTDSGLYLAGKNCIYGLGNYSNFINIPTVVASFTSSDTTICKTGCITYANTSSSNCTFWNWSFPGGNVTAYSGQTPPAICYANAGSYVTRLIAGDSVASDTVTQNITVNAANAGNIVVQRDTVCPGNRDELTLNNSKGQIQWQSSDSLPVFANISGAGDTSYSPILSATTYFRAVASYTTCGDTSAPFKVIVVPSPVASFTSSISGLTVIFNSDSSSSNVRSYNWNFGDNTISNLANPTHTFATKDTFNICLTVYNGSNCSYTLCKTINLIPNGINPVNEYNNSVIIYPNPFSAKATILINGLEGSNIDFSLYNVLGQKLMEENNIVSPFTLYRGQLPEGVYFYRVKDKVLNEDIAAGKVVVE